MADCHVKIKLQYSIQTLRLCSTLLWYCNKVCAFFQLNEEKRLLEQRRLQEEKAKAEIRLQLEEMERQRKEKEEKKRQDIEKQGKLFTDWLLFE